MTTPAWETFTVEPEVPGIRAQLALVPESPGLYVWRRDSGSLARALRTNAQNAPEGLRDLLCGQHTLKRMARIPPILEVELRSRRDNENQESFARKLGSKTQTDSTLREALADLLELTAPIAPPLYVGRTKNLRRRIQEHLDGITQVSERLEEIGEDLNRCTLTVHVLNTTPEAQHITELLERVAAHILLPTFSEKYGD